MSEEMLFQRDDLEHALSDHVHESDESKYLIFRSSDILYAMSTDVVMEIFTHVDVTRIPMVPEYIAGVINLRGAVVPIIDFRLRLGRYPESEPCAIILDIEGEEKQKLTKQQLIDMFAQKGASMDSDEVLLTKG